jgi:hypothetical protein
MNCRNPRGTDSRCHGDEKSAPQMNPVESTSILAAIAAHRQSFALSVTGASRRKKASNRDRLAIEEWSRTPSLRFLSKSPSFRYRPSTSHDKLFVYTYLAADLRGGFGVGAP